MSGFEISKNRYSKVTGEKAAQERGEDVRAIIEVSRDGYVPKSVQMRERIGDRMFTADVPTSALEDLEKDDKVKSVSVSRNLRVIE